jgi:hypothetical protein
MSKKLDTTAIQNELSGQSVFFQQQKHESNDEKEESVRPVREVHNVRNVRDVRTPTKRERKRHPFDIYRDQLEKLQQMKVDHMMKAGEMISMSAMVRDALDEYINKNK